MTETAAPAAAQRENSDEQRQERIRREVATWPERYATVREALALGFVPDAYGTGNREGPLLRPPTRFAYPDGGLAYPHHGSGPAAGSRFRIWSFAEDEPDALRDRAVWYVAAAGPEYWHYPQRSGLTLPQGWATCMAMAAHYRAHFIVPDWVNGCPDLRAAEWRELLTLEVRAGQDGQLALGGLVPPSPEEEAQETIRRLVPDVGDDDRLLLRESRGTIYGVERLIERANRARWQRGVPPVELDGGASR